METKDLTPENLMLLIDISNSYNAFNPGTLSLEKARRDTPEETFLKILWYSNYELYTIDKFKDIALDFIYKTALNQMPKYLTPDYNNVWGSETLLEDYNWVPVVAQWRLRINR